MRFGIADYGMNVWAGGFFDLEERLLALKEIGYEGLERLTGASSDDAVHRAAVFHRHGMGFGTALGPNPALTVEWASAFGCEYVWTAVKGGDFETFCRQVNDQVKTCAGWNLRVGLHNHLGSLVETQDQLEEFLKQCPDCGLILDTAHLAAAEGDPVEIVGKYPDRLVAVHLKDWIVTNPDVGIGPTWTQRGRFCELGAGNIGLDNIAVMKELVKTGYDGWVFVEHDTHLRDPLEDLKVSRTYLSAAGF